MLSSTSLLEDLKELGYDVMHVTSKFGAFVNDKKVNRHIHRDTKQGVKRIEGLLFSLFYII